MKALLNVIFLVLPMIFLSQNNSKKIIPQEVKDSFQKQYPGVEEAKWETEGKNYEVEFKQGLSDISVLYDAKGNLIETETEIKPEELLQETKKYIRENYKGQNIKEASVIKKSDGTLMYEAEIKGIDLYFNSEGSFIKAEKK